jgi:NADH-quinone oxidoreductase subunit J
MTPMQLIFIIVAFVTLFSAVMVVSVRRMMHSALFLVLALMGVAALFALLESTFFAIIQVLVYIGSIAILIIFAVMLTRHVMTVEDAQLNRGWWHAAVLMVILLAGFLNLILKWQPFAQSVNTLPPGEIGTAHV